MRALVLVLVSGVAAADEPITIDATSEAPASEHQAPPLLRFEPGLALDVETFDDQTLAFERGPIELHLTGAWRVVPEARRRDNDLVRNWRTGVGGSLDLGWARLAADATYEHAENELGRGRSVAVGISLVHARRLSKNVTGFLSLSAGRRQWLGAPLPGEFDATQVMLSIGIRWR